MLTQVELERGWVEFICPAHGFLVATSPASTVTCRCGKHAYTERDGVRLTNRDRKALQLADKKTAIDTLPAKKARPRGKPFPAARSAA